MNWNDHYLRYCDDIAILHHERAALSQVFTQIESFVIERLRLTLHPNKILFGRYSQGIDILGFVCFPRYRLLRTKTKWRMLRRISSKNRASYMGLLQHARAYEMRKIARRYSFLDRGAVG